MSRTGRPPERHMVDGRAMTVSEIAEMLGISTQALHIRRSRLGGISYQAIVNMYRANMFGSDRDRAPRYMVDGKWMTYKQLAEQLGVQPCSLADWRCRTGGSIEDAVNHFREYVWRGRKRNPQGQGGRPARQYRVGNRCLSVPQVAKMFGVGQCAVGRKLALLDGDMGAVIKFYKAREAKRRRRAEDEIMRILGY